MFSFKSKNKNLNIFVSIFEEHMAVINSTENSFFRDIARRSRVFYEAPSTNICDICEDSDCSSICDGKTKYQKRDKDSGATTIIAHSPVPLYLCTIICGLISKYYV